MKVLHCPTTVGGNPSGLARAERRLGVDSVSWALIQNYFAYPVDRVICPAGGMVARGLGRWRAIGGMLGRFDVVHFNFGDSFAPRRIATCRPGRNRWLAAAFNRVWGAPLELADVRWAKRLGAVIAVTFQGDDIRQGDFCRTRYPVHFAHDVPPDYYTGETDRQKRERIRFFDRHADLIYAVNPDLLNTLPARARFVAYASVDPREWTPVIRTDGAAHEPLVVHAPSNRAVKGTRYLLDAVQKLQAMGIRFRFQLIENMSHAEARRMYESADLAVDQLLAGFYGAFAVELMALGKPVICQLNQPDLRWLPQQMRRDIPLIHADPSSIEPTLRLCLTTRRSELRELGARGRGFVEQWHDPLRIAEQLIADYRTALSRRSEARRNDAAAVLQG
ncbi:MAG: hypothetical protein Q7S40_19110 [Opitutaceae bacterium]|nr:hypothetical protein [Opitutaceae bacterium]